jgi:hypothetical protein
MLDSFNGAGCGTPVLFNHGRWRKGCQGLCGVKNYYAILGLPSTATPAEIDAAFRSLARKYHPDLRPEGEDATSQFKLVTEAHEVLSNAEKRREYDPSAGGDTHPPWDRWRRHRRVLPRGGLRCLGRARHRREDRWTLRPCCTWRPRRPSEAVRSSCGSPFPNHALAAAPKGAACARRAGGRARSIGRLTWPCCFPPGSAMARCCGFQAAAERRPWAGQEAISSFASACGRAGDAPFRMAIRTL